MNLGKTFDENFDLYIKQYSGEFKIEEKKGMSEHKFIEVVCKILKANGIDNSESNCNKHVVTSSFSVAKLAELELTIGFGKDLLKDWDKVDEKMKLLIVKKLVDMLIKLNCW